MAQPKAYGPPEEGKSANGSAQPGLGLLQDWWITSTVRRQECTVDDLQV